MNRYSLTIEHENGIDMIGETADCFSDVWKKFKKRIKSYKEIKKIEVRVFD